MLQLYEIHGFSLGRISTHRLKPDPGGGMRIHEVATTSAAHFRALLTSPICHGSKKRLNFEIIMKL